MSDYIPPDLWPQILTKLAPETLLRCRCVCKSWKFLISSPSFIASHLAFQKPLLIARESNKLQEIQHENYVLFRPQTLPCFDFRFRSDPHSNFRFRSDPHSTFRIIGTVNGVVCLADDFLGITETIVLWNPLIRRCVYPPTPIHSSPTIGYTSTLGFGFDPSENDLKIVRIASVVRGCLFGRRCQYRPQAEVFSFREWKWRSIDYDYTACYTSENRWSQCLLNGAAHWPAFSRSTRNVLVSFNFGKEEFKLIELPLELRRCQVSVSKLGNLLSVLNYKHTYRVSGAHGCDIWAMHKYGEASSWCKMVSFNWEGGGLRNVMWVREDGGEVIVSTESEEVLCYNPCNQYAKLIGIRCKGDGYFADGFVGSLVLLDDELRHWTGTRMLLHNCTWDVARKNPTEGSGGMNACHGSLSSDLLNNK